MSIRKEIYLSFNYRVMVPIENRDAAQAAYTALAALNQRLPSEIRKDLTFHGAHVSYTSEDPKKGETHIYFENRQEIEEAIGKYIDPPFKVEGEPVGKD
jgi:hypothetical protein